jgi:hypothetical protein
MTERNWAAEEVVDSVGRMNTRHSSLAMQYFFMLIWFCGYAQQLFLLF